MIDEFIAEICSKEKLNLFLDYAYCDANEGCVAGNDVFLGKFDNDEYKLAAFFHEIGHTKIQEPYLLKIENEINAWVIGFNLMATYGCAVNMNHILYCLSRLHTYTQYEYREVTISGLIDIIKQVKGNNINAY